MIYGFIDESGTPGMMKYEGECLLASLVLFDSERVADKAVLSIERLRKKLYLPEDYEFHFHSNSTRPQTEFLKLLAVMDFRFISVAIHKNNVKKTASYKRLSELLVGELMKRGEDMKIEMDSNPIFYAELKKELKVNGVKNIKLREQKSHSNRLLQVADYVAGISARKVKNTEKSREWYKLVAKKVSAFIEVAD